MKDFNQNKTFDQESLLLDIERNDGLVNLDELIDLAMDGDMSIGLGLDALIDQINQVCVW